VEIFRLDSLKWEAVLSDAEPVVTRPVMRSVLQPVYVNGLRRLVYEYANAILGLGSCRRCTNKCERLMLSDILCNKVLLLLAMLIR
jgi:hypothetical protein